MKIVIIGVVLVMFGVALLAGSVSAKKKPLPPPPAQCADGQDNDLDGFADFPADPGCSSASDNDEIDIIVQPCPPDVCMSEDPPVDTQ